MPAGLYDEISGAGAVTAQTSTAISTLQLANANNFTLAAGQTLTVNGILKSGGAAATTISGGAGIQPASGAELVIRTDQVADSLTIAMPILANGANAVTKSGAGTLTLSGANSYSGGTYVNAGILAIDNGGVANASAIGTGPLVFTGGTIDNTAAIPLTVGTNNAQSWSGNFSYGGTQSLNLGTGTVTITGNSAMPSTLALNAGAASTTSTLTVGGNISLATTPIPATAANTLDITGLGNVALGGTISNGGGTGASLGLTMNGSGTLTLSGANTFSGGLAINAGTVAYSNGVSTDNNLGSGIVTLNGGTLSLSGTTTEFTTANTYLIGPNGGTFNLNGTAQYNNSTKIDFNTANQITGSGTITKTGLGDMWVTNSQGFGGAWIIDGGYVEVTSNTGLGSGTVTLNAGGELVNSGGRTIGNTLMLNNGSILSVDNSGTGIYTGNVTVSGSVNMIPADFYQAADPGRAMTLSGAIGGSGSITESITNDGYTSTSPGTLTLSGPNTYTGGTIVNAGTLTVSGAGTLGATTGTLQVNNPNTGSGTNVVVNLSTTSPTTIGSLSGTIAAASIGTNFSTINTAAGQTFTVNQTTPGTFAGTIAGSGSFTLGSLSSSPLILAGANAYTGGTAVNAGTLIMTSPANSLGNASNLTVAGGAAFDYEPTAAGGLNLGAAGNLTLAGGSTIGTALAGNTNQSAITANTLSLAGNLTVNVFGVFGADPTAGANSLISASNVVGTPASVTYNVYNATDFTVSGETISSSGIAANVVTGLTPMASAYWIGGYSGGNNVWAISDGAANSNWLTAPPAARHR